MAKILGADIRAYYQEWPLGDDWYLDDFDPGDFQSDVKYDSGELPELYLQANFNLYSRNDVEYGRDLGREIMKWLKAQSTVTLIVDAPRDKARSVAEVVKALGATVRN